MHAVNGGGGRAHRRFPRSVRRELCNQMVYYRAIFSLGHSGARVAGRRVQGRGAGARHLRSIYASSTQLAAGSARKLLFYMDKAAAAYMRRCIFRFLDASTRVFIFVFRELWPMRRCRSAYRVRTMYASTHSVRLTPTAKRSRVRAPHHSGNAPNQIPAPAPNEPEPGPEGITTTDLTLRLIRSNMIGKDTRPVANPSRARAAPA